MTISELKNDVYYYVQSNYGKLITSTPSIRLKYNSITAEIIARLFVLSFRKIRPDSFAYITINDYNNSKEDDDSPTFDSHLQYYRRRAKKLMIAHRNKFNSISEYISIPDTLFMENNHKGRYFDIPNILLTSNLDSKPDQDLLNLIFDGRICSSKKVSDGDIVKAYTNFDSDYSNVKDIEDKIDYIFHWINFHRLETDLSLSIIPKIAQGMIDAGFKDFDEDFLRDIFGQNTYQILTYDNYIAPLFCKTNVYDIEKTYGISQTIRYIETCTITHFNMEYPDIFEHFFNGKEDYINQIYDFCLNEYPIIEMHEDSNLYLENGEINHAKIKLIRKLMDILVSPEQIKELFKKAP